MGFLQQCFEIKHLMKWSLAQSLFQSTFKVLQESLLHKKPVVFLPHSLCIELNFHLPEEKNFWYVATENGEKKLIILAHISLKMCRLFPSFNHNLEKPNKFLICKLKINCFVCFRLML